MDMFDRHTSCLVVLKKGTNVELTTTMFMNNYSGSRRLSKSSMSS